MTHDTNESLDHPTGMERRTLQIELQEQVAQLESEIAAIKSTSQDSDGEMISVQAAWEAAGGHPEMKVSKAVLLYNLRLLDAVCDDRDEPSETGEQIPAADKQAIALRTVPREVAIKALETAFRDISSGLIDVLRGEPSLSLPGERRLAVYADRIRAMQAGLYVNSAVEDAIEKLERENRSK